LDLETSRADAAPIGNDSTPPESKQRAQALANMGMYLVRFKEFVKSEAMMRECVELREKLQPGVWNTFTAQSLLGGSLLGQQRYDEAEPLLLTGFEGMKKQQDKIPPPGRMRLVEAAERLVQLYEAKQNKDEAAKWNKELEEAKAWQSGSEQKP
jgi:hypothetical protein